MMEPKNERKWRDRARLGYGIILSEISAEERRKKKSTDAPPYTADVKAGEVTVK